MCNSMKMPKTFETFIYRHRLVDLRGKQALRSMELKKLEGGLMIGFTKSTSMFKLYLRQPRFSCLLSARLFSPKQRRCSCLKRSSRKNV